MNNTVVYLIRHGEIDNPKRILYGKSIDMKLNDRGRRQIRNLAKKFIKYKRVPQKIFTSPLSRAVESAQILAGELKLESKPIIKEELIDIDIPFLAGKSFGEREKIHKSGTDEYSEKYVKLGNEPRNHVIKRLKKVFKKIALKNKGNRVAIVSHGDPIQFLLYYLLNPGKIIPSMNILASKNYPPKGSAVKLVLDKNLDVIERAII